MGQTRQGDRMSDFIVLHTDTVAPGSTDDASKGYGIGTLWVDTAGDLTYICVDDTTDAAVWNNLVTASSTDTNAIHKTTSGEIAGLTAKATPVSADLLLIEDSAASNAKKKVQIGNLPGGGSVVLGMSGAAATIAKGATSYVGVGTGGVTATEANAEFYVPVAGTVQNLRTYVSLNDAGADGSTITIRKNGVSQSLVTTYNTGVTGLQSDTSNSFSVAAGDRISIEVVNAGSGGGTKDLVVETVTLEISL